jgi:hypothetical protein
MVFPSAREFISLRRGIEAVVSGQRLVTAIRAKESEFFYFALTGN